MDHNQKILISAVLVVAITLVSFNLEGITGNPIAGTPADYGGSRVIEFYQNGNLVNTIKSGSIASIEVKVKPSNPNIYSMKLGYSIESEKLQIKGPGANIKPSNYRCVEGRTSNCKLADVSVSPETHWKGPYTFSIVSNGKTLGSSILRVV